MSPFFVENEVIFVNFFFRRRIGGSRSSGGCCSCKSASLLCVILTLTVAIGGLGFFTYTLNQEINTLKKKMSNGKL